MRRKSLATRCLLNPCFHLVPEVGIEPTRGCPRGILSPKLTIYEKPMFSDINLFSLALLRSDLVGKK
jgi:hypothetical protein